MKVLFASLASILCLGCSPAAPETPAASVDIAAIETARPDGPWAVGVAAGPVLPDAGATRLYYPAERAGEGDGGAAPGGFGADHIAGLSRRFGPGLGEALSRAATTARSDAPPAAGPFPAVVFQPGAAMASTDYRLLIEALVSRGYVVLALHPEGSPPASGARYPEAAAESAEGAALIRSGAVPQADPRRLALIGHSLGGAASVMALQTTPRAVAVNLDGDYGAPARAPIGASILHLIGQTEGEAEHSRARRARAWTEATDGVADAVVLQVESLKHFDFADAALIQHAMSAERRRTRFGAIGGRAAQALTVDLVAAFLDSRLKGETAAWPAALARHPQAQAPTTW